MIPRPVLVIVLAAGVLAGCGGKGGGPGPTPVVDPPAVSCPVDLTVTGVAAPSQSVAFTVPTAIGGTAPVSVACAPDTGSAFPLGTTPVRCTASDAASRQGSCSFNVTLKGVNIAVTKYLAYGDSITEGQNGLPEQIRPNFVDPPNSYPTKLQALLEAVFAGQGITVANRGRGGERAEDARARLPEELALVRPGAVMIIDGYNNLLNECKTRDVSTVTPLCSLEIERAAGALREMVRVARASGVVYVFVGTLTPSGPATGPFDRRLLPAAVIQMNAKIRLQIPNEGATVVDIYPMFLGHEAEYSGPDGLHILPAGNEVIANAFFTAIKTVIPQTPVTVLSR